MKTTPRYSPLQTCSCCGRRDFLVAGIGASAALVLSRALGRAAEMLPSAGGAGINPIASAIPFAAQPLPLSAVRLTGGPLKHAQELGMANLLKLDMDRIMYRFRERAGLTPKAADGYGSWEGPGRQLTGAIAGHYLSAVSYMYAATGDARFKDRADYLVNEYKEVQDKQGDGYIGALMGNPPRGASTGPIDGKILFQQITQGDIRSGGFDLNGMWSPWYVQHKLFAGLRDAYRQTGNRAALDVSIKFGAWVESIVGNLSHDQLQKMLATEFGGINESLADLYADTGDKRWLALSQRFHHEAIVDPLAAHTDILTGKHGNTNVPKLIGELARYIYAGNAADGEAGKFFWEAVVYHHSFATGGHGYDEAFGAPDKLSGEVDGTVKANGDTRTCESCNVYNMVKLTRLLFALEPNDKFAEFHERALFNHVLASINFDDGQLCYMVPVGQGVTHEYQGNGMTCCVGTGLENHALHAYGIYNVSADKLWVNLFAPSTAQWKEQGVAIAMETNFPEGSAASLKFATSSPKEFTLALRRPAWAGEGFAIKVNGEMLENLPKAGAYAELKRTWKTGDAVEVVLPKTLRKEALPDNANRLALMYGPLVLGADLGPGSGGRGGRRGGGGAAPTKYPVFLAKADEPIGNWLKRTNVAAPDSQTEAPATFHATGVDGDNNEIDFKPFYQLSGRRYGIYWDVYTPEEWAQSGGQLDAETQKRRKVEAATVAFAQPGQMQPERDYNFQGEDATVITGDTTGRWGTKWFSFDLPVDNAHPMVLLITYNSGDPTSRTFDILVDGTRLKTEKTATALPAQLVDIEYAIPAELVRGKQKVTIRFEAASGNSIAGVYGLRMIRGDAGR